VGRRGRVVRVLTSGPARVVATALVLGVLAVVIDWARLADTVAGGDWGWLPPAVLAFAAALAVGGVRWQLFLAAAGVPTTVVDAVRGYFLGSFMNVVLPTGFGGDAARAAFVASDAGVARAITTVTVDRMSAMACLLALGIAGALMWPGDVPAELDVLLAVTTVMGVLGIGLLVLSSRSARVRRLVPERLIPAAQTVLATLRLYAANRPLLVRTTLLGFAYQALVVLCTVWLGRAIGLDLEAALVAAALPLVLLVTLVPITIAGLGVREGGFVALLGTAGVAAEPATLLSLLSLATAAVASLPGALVLLSWQSRPRAQRYPRQSS
jgi:uncharacterized protein (TIRG00374 family)